MIDRVLNTTRRQNGWV